MVPLRYLQKIKRFCVLRSPHVDKDSREHFELRLYKRFIDLNTTSSNSRLIIKNRITCRCFMFFKILENQ
jgi:ribosomal protein S10